MAATIVMFAAAVILATVLVVGDRGGGSGAADQAGCATAETTTVTTTPSEETRDAEPDDQHDIAVRQLRAHLRCVGNGCAGLRRSFGALRCGQFARGGNQNVELTGDRVRDNAGQLLLPR